MATLVSASLRTEKYIAVVSLITLKNPPPFVVQEPKPIRFVARKVSVGLPAQIGGIGLLKLAFGGVPTNNVPEFVSLGQIVPVDTIHIKSILRPASANVLA
jgi:hypothetical protein